MLDEIKDVAIEIVLKDDASEYFAPMDTVEFHPEEVISQNGINKFPMGTAQGPGLDGEKYVVYMDLWYYTENGTYYLLDINYTIA